MDELAMTYSLHSIQCEGPGACSCSPIYVRETPVETERMCDNGRVGMSDETQSHSRLAHGVPGDAHPIAGAPFAYLEDESR